MLTLHFAETFRSQTPFNECPMQGAVNHNFVSQLRTSDIAFTEHAGPLGIKCCFGGQEIYEVEGSRFAVDASSYLVLNNGQRYASILRNEQEAESFCIWFRPAFAEQTLSSLRTPADRLLEDPRLASRQPVHFFERLYPHDELVSPVLFRIRQAIHCNTASQPWLEEQFHLLLEKLLQSQRSIYRDVERLPAIRSATRVELYRRLYRAKDFLDANLERPITLPEMAEIACLSPHHFLRQFKSLFDETPHSYHRRKRLERAQNLLASTELSVTEICFDLGFESLGSFSWLFRGQFGMSPTEYRCRFAHHRRIMLMAAADEAIHDRDIA